MPLWTTPPPLGGLLNNANASSNGDWAAALVRPALRNSTQPGPLPQTADGIPERRLSRRTYSVSPASVFDTGASTGASAVPFVSSNDANYPGCVLGRFAPAGTDPQEANQPVPLVDDEEQANLRALDARLSSTGSIRDAVALYLARKARRRLTRVRGFAPENADFEIF